MILKGGSTTVIHVRSRDGSPLVTVKNKGRTFRCQKAEVIGIGRLVGGQRKPSPNGSRFWIETTSPVRLIGVQPIHP